MFGISDQEEDEAYQEEQGYTETEYKDDGGDAESNFKWLKLIDNVSETVREPWNKVWEMNVYEFFNIVSYYNWKMETQKKAVEKFVK